MRAASTASRAASPRVCTLEALPNIQQADLKNYVGRVLARDNLKVGVVGDIDAKELGLVLDRIFGELPAKANLNKVPEVKLASVGKTLQVDLDVPQTVVAFGGVGIPRKDPDYITAFIVNHILGGGSFSSRLYKEVREKRGLAYSVYSYLLPMDSAALFMGGTQTRTDKAHEAVGLIEEEIKRLAQSGPTEEELDKAKSYLKGSYALNFDTSTKIAGQLVQLQVDELGIDYWDRRNGLIDAVSLVDVRRVAKRLLDGGVLTTAGNLVFEGTTKQTFAAFRATDGALLWEMPVQSAPVSGPITYEMDGVQYVAVNAGWGGGAAQVERGAGTAQNRASARLLVFKLGAKKQLPPLKPAPPIPEPPPLRAPEATVQKGAEIFARTCAQCHGQLAVGGVKDLRQMTRDTHAQFNDIVLKGLRVQKGMASFANLLSAEDVEAVHAYVISRAQEDWGATPGTGGPH